MKALTFLGLFLLAATFLTSCELSPYAIDDHAVINADARLLGKWKQKEKAKESDLYTLIKKDEFHYTVKVKEHGNHHRNLKYDAYLSDVNDVRFLNILYKDDSTSGYLLLRILDINPAANLITATPVADSTMQFATSSAAVREKIRTNLNNPKFYGDTVHFYKVK